MTAELHLEDQNWKQSQIRINRKTKCYLRQQAKGQLYPRVRRVSRSLSVEVIMNGVAD